MKNPVRILFGFAAALAAPFALNAADIDPGAGFKVASVQMRSSRNLSDNVSRITNSIHDCAQKGARVVVFPECALSSYVEAVLTNLSAAQLAAARDQVADACRQAGVYAVVGTSWREGEKLFDSALIIAPTGKVIERYDKL